MNSEMCKCGHDQEQHHAESGCRAVVFGEVRGNIRPLEFCPCDKFVLPRTRLPGGTLRERLDKLGPELGRMLAEDIAEIERG